KMPELIENGHLYVAQPPLYRVLEGKKETFIKDEEEFNTLLLQRISEKEKVLTDKDEEISGYKLVKFLNGVIKFYENLNILTRKGFSERFIKFMASQGATNLSQFKDEEFMSTLFERLNENGFSVSDVNVDEEDGYYDFFVKEIQNGGQKYVVNWEFLSSLEFRKITRIYDEIGDIHQGGYILKGDDDMNKIDDPQQLLSRLFEKVKRGLTIQRYKGLGEMNPEQLWTTTMDPEKRTLLKVQIKDWVESDDLFTILMGDKVEPRRKFIQDNALEVVDLDI
ncbi:MAG: DNA gyrase subunit B, partial [Thermodesulfobacteriota bacterium]|nr:DNA gyrase subunit B [Thermodesulfobacteriota bacterium]